MKINKMISKAMAAAVAATMLIGSSAVMADELDSNYSKSDNKPESIISEPIFRHVDDDSYPILRIDLDINFDSLPEEIRNSRVIIQPVEKPDDTEYPPLITVPGPDDKSGTPRIILPSDGHDDDTEVGFVLWEDLDEEPEQNAIPEAPESNEQTPAPEVSTSQETPVVSTSQETPAASTAHAVSAAPAASTSLAAPAAPAVSTAVSAPVTLVADAVRLDPDDFVNHLYAKALGRTADPAGYAYWTGLISSGEMTNAEAAYAVLTSAEFEARDLNNVDFVTVLYSVFFNREPDHNGLNHWVSSIKNGEMTRAQVIDAFIGSPEWTNS